MGFVESSHQVVSLALTRYFGLTSLVMGKTTYFSPPPCPVCLGNLQAHRQTVIVLGTEDVPKYGNIILTCNHIILLDMIPVRTLQGKSYYPPFFKCGTEA